MLEHKRNQRMMRLASREFQTLSGMFAALPDFGYSRFAKLTCVWARYGRGLRKCNGSKRLHELPLLTAAECGSRMYLDFFYFCTNVFYLGPEICIKSLRILNRITNF